MSYRIIDRIVTTYEPESSASEAHGIASGMLCLHPDQECLGWLQTVFEEIHSLSHEDVALLHGLFEQTKALLSGSDCSFDLFLPDEEASLQEQVEAISKWCQGFLFGIGAANSSSEWPQETQEIIKDIVEISKVSIEDDDPGQENDLMELQEYLRVAVMLLQQGNDNQNNNGQKHTEH